MNVLFLIPGGLLLGYVLLLFTVAFMPKSVSAGKRAWIYPSVVVAPLVLTFGVWYQPLSHSDRAFATFEGYVSQVDSAVHGFTRNLPADVATNASQIKLKSTNTLEISSLPGSSKTFAYDVSVGGLKSGVKVSGGIYPLVGFCVTVTYNGDFLSADQTGKLYDNYHVCKDGAVTRQG